jgi:hypothetical protein
VVLFDAIIRILGTLHTGLPKHFLVVLRIASAPVPICPRRVGHSKQPTQQIWQGHPSHLYGEGFRHGGTDLRLFALFEILVMSEQNLRQQQVDGMDKARDPWETLASRGPKLKRVLVHSSQVPIAAGQRRLPRGM